MLGCASPTLCWTMELLTLWRDCHTATSWGLRAKRAYLKEIWAGGYLGPDLPSPGTRGCAHETDNMMHGEHREFCWWKGCELELSIKNQAAALGLDGMCLTVSQNYHRPGITACLPLCFLPFQLLPLNQLPDFHTSPLWWPVAKLSQNSSCPAPKLTVPEGSMLLWW